jgi:hypothetical protein
MTTNPDIQQQVAQLQAQLIALATKDTTASDGKGFPDAPVFDGTKPEELRTWILQLRNKLAAQPSRYPTEETSLRYALNRLSGTALNLVRSNISETSGQIKFKTLNELLDLLRQAYDDPDRARTAAREIRKLRKKNSTFAAYLAEFGRIIGDLDWNEEVQKEQLYEGLSEEIKDALITTRPKQSTLKAFIQTCKELDNRIRARNAERNSSRSTPRPPFRSTTASTSGSTTQTPPTSIPRNPTATNSGYYGAAPMDLSATQKNAERNRIKQERIARGECIYCGITGHFLRECPQRAAAHARRLTMAAATITVDPATVPEATPSIEQSEN